jgi:hypothetical protein
VPPFDTASVPVIVIEPDVVIGPPVKVKPVTFDATLMLVTVPEPAIVPHDAEEPFVGKYLPL